MVEVIITKIVLSLKALSLLLVFLLKITFAPLIILYNSISDNQINYDMNTMTDLKIYAHKTLHTVGASFISMKVAFVLILMQALAFCLPLKEFFLTVISLVILDTVSALYALYKTEGSFSGFYEKWTSRRAMDTVKKSVWYCLLGLMLYIVGSGIGEAELMKKVALGLVGYIEGKSFIENVDKILGTNIWELVSDFIKTKFLPNKD